MGGLFGVVSKTDCVTDLFFGTDYHSHFGTKRGGLAVLNPSGFTRFIHNIENAQFRSKFETDIKTMSGNKGIGVISDFDDQPLLIRSHLGNYAIVTVGVVQNIEELVKKAFREQKIHFRDMSGGEINPTELVATLINQESTFTDGIKSAQEAIEGSCSLLLLTDDGSSLRIAETSISRRKVRAGEKASGLRLKGYKIDLKKSSIFSQVVREGKTVQVNVSDIIGELFPRPLASLIVKTMGYEKKPCILTPLKRRGKTIGALAMTSTDLAEHFIPSVRNLARHISTALELADEHAQVIGARVTVAAPVGDGRRPAVYVLDKNPVAPDAGDTPGRTAQDKDVAGA